MCRSIILIGKQAANGKARGPPSSHGRHSDGQSTHVDAFPHIIVLFALDCTRLPLYTLPGIPSHQFLSSRIQAPMAASSAHSSHTLTSLTVPSLLKWTGSDRTTGSRNPGRCWHTPRIMKAEVNYQTGLRVPKWPSPLRALVVHQNIPTSQWESGVYELISMMQRWAIISTSAMISADNEHLLCRSVSLCIHLIKMKYHKLLSPSIHYCGVGMDDNDRVYGDLSREVFYFSFTVVSGW